MHACSAVAVRANAARARLRAAMLARIWSRLGGVVAFALVLLVPAFPAWRPDVAKAQAPGGIPATGELVHVRVGKLVLTAPPAAARVLNPLAVHAQRILPALAIDLGIEPSTRFEMYVMPPGVPDDPALDALNRVAPPWAAGFMLPSQRIGVIRIAQASRYPYGTLEAVLAHETTHLLLHDAVGDRIPLWFNEGVATLEGRRWSLEDAMVYSGGLLTSDLPALDELDAAFHASESEARLAYAASFAFVSESVRLGGPGFLRRVIEETRRRPFPDAWRAVTGTTLEQAERSWRRRSLLRYRWIPIVTASSTLWLLISFLAIGAIARRRARQRAVREAWARAEAFEAELPEGWDLPAAPEDAPAPPRGPPPP